MILLEPLDLEPLDLEPLDLEPLDLEPLDLDLHHHLAVDRLPARVIDEVSVVVAGTTARLHCTTDAPMLEIVITPFRPVLADGVWVDWVLDAVDAVAFVAGGGPVDHFAHGLRPGIEYHYIVTAPGDRGGSPAQAVGSFLAGHTAVASLAG